MRNIVNDRGASWFDIVEECPGQIDITYTNPGAVRAFHMHRSTKEWIFVVSGTFKFVFTDPDEQIVATPGDVVIVAPGRWHGIQNTSDVVGIYMEYADRKFEITDPDDLVKPPDTFHKWRHT